MAAWGLKKKKPWILPRNITYYWLVGGWTNQPIWKICDRQIGSFPQLGDEHKNANGSVKHLLYPRPPRSFNSSTRKSCLVTPIGRWLVFRASIFSGAFAVELREGFCDHLNTAYTAIHFDQSPLRKEVLHIPDSQYCEEKAPLQYGNEIHLLTSSCWCCLGNPKKKNTQKHIVKGPLTNQHASLEKMVPCTKTAQMLLLYHIMQELHEGSCHNCPWHAAKNVDLPMVKNKSVFFLGWIYFFRLWINTNKVLSLPKSYRNVVLIAFFKTGIFTSNTSASPFWDTPFLCYFPINPMVGMDPMRNFTAPRCFCQHLRLLTLLGEHPTQVVWHPGSAGFFFGGEVKGRRTTKTPRNSACIFPWKTNILLMEKKSGDHQVIW